MYIAHNGARRVQHFRLANFDSITARTRKDVSPHGVFSSENVQFWAAPRFYFRRQFLPRAFPRRFFQEPCFLAKKIQIPGSENRLADSTSGSVSDEPGTDVAATTVLGPDRGTATRYQIGVGPTYQPAAPFVGAKSPVFAAVPRYKAARKASNKSIILMRLSLRNS